MENNTYKDKILDALDSLEKTLNKGIDKVKEGTSKGIDKLKEEAILEELSRYPQVKSTMGLAGIEIMEGRKLTDALRPRERSELIGLD